MAKRSTRKYKRKTIEHIEEETIPQRWKNVGIITFILVATVATVFLGYQLGLYLNADRSSVGRLLPIAEHQPGEPYVETKKFVYVRTGSSKMHPVIGIAPPAKPLPIIGVSSDFGWYLIAIDADNFPIPAGWISAVNAKITDAEDVPILEPPPVPNTIYVEPPAEDDPRIEVMEMVEVYEGPGYEYASYGKILKGAIATVVGISSDSEWFAIKLPASVSSNEIGWIQVGYCEPINLDQVNVIDP